MPLTKSDYEAILKIHYFGAIVDQLENATVFLSRMQRYEEETGGKFLHIPMRTGRTTSIGARGDTTSAHDDLPPGDRPSYGFATFEPKSQYAVVQVSGKAQRSSRNPTFAFAQAQTRDMLDTTVDFKKDINRQLLGDGSAELAIISTTTNSTVVTITSNLYPTNPAKLLYAREKIDVRLITTLVHATGGNSISITSVDSPTQLTLSAAVTTTAGAHAIYREDNAVSAAEATTAAIREMFGLSCAVAAANPSALYTTPVRVTANFGGVNRASAGNDHWKGSTLSNGGTLRSFSVSLIEEGIDLAETAAAGEISLILWPHAINRVYGALLIAAKQYDGNMMNLDGGFKALSVNGVPCVKEVECPDYTIFLLDEATWYLGVYGPWSWLENDSGGILTRITGKDQWEGVLNRDMELLCDKPRANVKISDVAHS